jgi:hypothetical protein
MNERLTVLCEQAISEVWESRKGPDGLVRTDGNPYIFYEKFAELIVRECIRAYNDDGYQTEYEQDLKVLQHFGVEL